MWKGRARLPKVLRHHPREFRYLDVWSKMGKLSFVRQVGHFLHSTVGYVRRSDGFIPPVTGLTSLWTPRPYPGSRSDAKLALYRQEKCHRWMDVAPSRLDYPGANGPAGTCLSCLMLFLRCRWRGPRCRPTTPTRAAACRAARLPDPPVVCWRLRYAPPVVAMSARLPLLQWLAMCCGASRRLSVPKKRQ